MGICCSKPPAGTCSAVLPLQLSPHALSIWGLCPGAAGEILTCSEDKTIGVYDQTSNRTIHHWRGHQKAVSRISYMPLAVLAVSGSRDTSVKLWDRNFVESAATYSAHALPVTGIAALEQQGQVCSGSRDCTLRLWDIASSAEVRCTSIPQNVVTFMKAVSGEALVLQAGEDLHLRLWDTRTMQAVSLLPQHSNIPLSCDVSHDGLYFATSCNGFDGEGCEVCLWDRRKLQQLWQWKGHQQATAACIFMPEMCTAASESHVHLCSPWSRFDSANPAANQNENGENTEYSQALLKQPANLMVASASADCTVRVSQMGQKDELCMAHNCNTEDHSALTSLAYCSAQAGETEASNNFLFASSFSGQLQSWRINHISELGHDAMQHVSLSIGMSDVHRITHGTASNGQKPSLSWNCA